MFPNRLRHSRTPLTGSDLLAEIGLQPGAVRDVIDDDPRQALSGPPRRRPAVILSPSPPR